MTTMTTSLVSIRYGAPQDVAAVTALHDRCSDRSLYRRYHAPLPRLPGRLARQLLCPDGGWSLLAERAGEVVAMACAGPLSSTDLEVGLLVQDACQGRGIGVRLLRELATSAAGRGYRALHCLTQPDNDAALATIRRTGLVHTPVRGNGLLRIEMPLQPEERVRPRPA
jgi:ribosomal protein S18 acetylase RimI-like enzyme